MNIPRAIDPAADALAAEARRRALAEWRRLDLDPMERARKDTSRPISDLMPKVSDKLGLERRRAETEIVRVWNHLIDPTIAAHAQPTGIRNGTLFVTVDNSVWLSEIVRYRRREILDRLQYSFGREMVARISFRVG